MRQDFFRYFYIIFLIAAFAFSTNAFAQLAGGTAYPINGTENPPVSFQSITTAVSYLTANGVTGTGEVILELSTGYTGEPGPVNIGPITGTSATLGVTFRPAAGYTALTSIAGGATPNQHAIRLAGCNYITLDGRAGGIGTSRDWTVRVTGAGTSGLGQMAVRLDNTPGSMTGIVVRNLIMEGESANVTGAIFQITGNTTNIISNIIIENNLIQSTSTVSTSTRGYGVTLAVASNIGNTGIIFRNNIITRFYARGINLTGGFPGIEVYGNEIYHDADITQPTVTEFSAIYYSTTASPGSKIYNNYIHSIRLTNGSTAINGLFIFNGNSTGLPALYYNNRVSIGGELSGTAAPLPVNGIRENALSGSLIEIDFNSVFVGGAAPSGSNTTAAFRKQTSNFIKLRNNIFYNARTNEGGTGTGVHWGIASNNTTYAAISNNNYFADGSGGVLGTTTNAVGGNQTTITGWLGAVSADVNSISQNPNFIAGLKINEAIPTQLESGGTPIAGITTDFEGDVRNSTTPDIGADEFNGIPLDLTPPSISYTLLANQSNLTSVTLTATITDFSGIAGGINSPRLYVKKSTDLTYVFVDNPSISGNDYTFTFNYSAIGGVAIGDVIQYYVAAQDVPGNAGTNPAGGSGSNPPGTIAPPTPNSFSIVDLPLSGTYTVGLAAFRNATGKNIYFETRTRTVTRNMNGIDAYEDINAGIYDKENPAELDLSPRYETLTETYVEIMEDGRPFDLSFFSSTESRGIYPTITAAINDLKLRGVSGPVIFSLVDSNYPTETYPIDLTAFAGASATNTVTIKPAAGVQATIPGDAAQTTATIWLREGGYYILDGSNTVGGSTRDLTITALGSSPAVHFYSSGDNNVVKNIVLQSQNTSTGSGTLILAAGTGSSNNVINNCLFKRIDSAPRYGIGVYTFSTFVGINNLISNCEFDDFNNTAIVFQGSAGVLNNDAVGNSIFQTTPSAATTIYGILVGRAPETDLVGNRIFNLSSTGATPTIAGIYYTGVSGVDMTVRAVNNAVSLGGLNLGGTIRGIDYFGWSANSFEMYYNTVLLSGSGVTTGTTGAVAKRDAAVNFKMVNNVFYNARSNGAGTGFHYAAQFSNTAATLLESNYNDYFADGTGGVLGIWATTATPTLLAWQTASSQDANSLGTNPLLVSESDLRPYLNSPVIGAGTPLAGITTDILGVNRSVTAPTLGAYEQGAPLPSVTDPTDVASASRALNINVSFTPNASNNNVVIVFNNTGIFTSPAGVPPAAGDPFAGGTLLYVGTASPFNHTGLTFNTTYHYKLFSYDGFSYSPGVTTSAVTSVLNPTNVTAVPVSVSEINIAWTKNVYNDNIMVVTNSVNTFGVPVNGTAYAVNDPVTGGGTVIYNGSASSFNHTMLTGGTNYFYRLFSVESPIDYYSTGVAVNATTPFELPYFQDFNAGTTLPAGWTGNFIVLGNHGTAGSNGLTRNLWSSATTGVSRSPFVGLAVSNTVVEFDYRIVNFTGYPNNATVLGPGNFIQIQVSTDNTNWTTIFTIDDVNHVTSTNFANKSFSLGAYAGSFVYVRFNAQWASGDYYVDIDNFYIGSPPVANPGSFTATSISDTQIDLAFTTNLSNNNVVIVWNNTGTFTTPSGTPPAFGDPFAGGTLLYNGTVSPVNHTGLTPSTSYYYKAFSYDGADYSTGLSASANTQCGLSSLPFSESFDGTTFPPLCWTRINNGLGNNWQRTTSGTYAGAGAMQYSYSTTQPADAWMITPGFALENGKKYFVTFYQRVQSSVYPEKLKVTVGTSPNVAAQTTVIWDNAGGTQLTNTVYEFRVAEFVAPAAGTYYFGFNVYSDADQWLLLVDEIFIYEQPAVDLAFNNFYQSSGLPVPRPGEYFVNYNVSMNKQTILDNQKQFIELSSLPNGVKASDVNNTRLLPNGSIVTSESLSDVEITGEIANLGANAASYVLDWAVDGAAQTTYNGPTVNPDASHLALLTYAPTERGTFYTTASITVTGDEIPGNNAAEPLRVRIYPDVFTRTIYDRGDNVIDTYIGWNSLTIPMKSGVRYTASADVKLAGVDFICRTEAVTSGQIIVQVRAEGTTTNAPGAVLYTKVYDTQAYIVPGEAGDYIHFAFGEDAPTIAAGSDYWITIKMPVGILFPGAAHSSGITPGRSFFEGSVDTTVWNPLVISAVERAWIMRSVEVATASTFQLSVDIAAGWNMVSVPGLHPTDQNVNTWWAGKDPAAGVFRFAGGYQAVTTVAPGTGYWMKHVGANTYNTGDEWPAGGILIVPNDPIPAVTGWNLIGGYHNTVATAGITTTPVGLISGQVFGYIPGSGYAAVTTLTPGYGYWIKLTGAGDINLPSSLAKSVPVSEYIKSDWGRIMLTDAAGKSYILYSVDGEVDLTQYELPPLPPAGMFDVRYGSQRLAEVIGSEIQTIEMQGIEYPVTVRVEGMTIRLQDETGKIVNQVIKSGEDVVISNPQVGKLKVSGNVIPETYSLEQNYPNPFNPSTTIEFSIPEDVENVKLTIYDALGQKVAELVNGKLEAGRYSYQWDASKLASGLYIYQLQTNKFTSTKKMMMLK